MNETKRLDKRAALEAQVRARMELANQRERRAPTEPAESAAAMNPAIAHIQGMKAGLHDRVKELELQLAAATKNGEIVLLDATKVVAGPWANRHAAAFADAQFNKLKDDIRKTNGNTDPILVRPIGEDRFELVYGHRRHRACLELGLPVTAIVKNVADDEVPLLMEWENEDREDLSAFEKGMSYARLIRDGWVANPTALAERLNRSKGMVSQLLAFAELPEALYNLFVDPRKLTAKDAAALRSSLREDESNFNRRIAEVKEANVRSAREIVAKLLAKQSAPDWVTIKSEKRPVFRAKKVGDRHVVEFPCELSRSVLNELGEFMAARLKGSLPG